MQGGRRRELDSFAPFRAEEIVEQKFKGDRDDSYTYYPTYAGRLRVARETLPGLCITTRLLKGDLRQGAVVVARVEATLTTGRIAGAGIGTADKQGDGRLSDSLLELAETRAITRALRTLGVGVEFNGAEEVVPRLREEEPPRRRRDSSDNERDERSRDARDEDPFEKATKHLPHVSEEQRDLVSWKAILGKDLMRRAKDDKALGKRMLLAVVGRESLGNLTQFECQLARLALETIDGCGGDMAKAKEMVADVWRLPWFDRMNETDYKIAKQHVHAGGVDLKTTKSEGAPPF